MLFLATVSVIFVVLGVLMIAQGKRIGWLACGFFGLCSLVFLVELLPNASSLELTADGFTVRSFFQVSKRIAWVEVQSFGIGRIRGKKMVMFNYAESYQGALAVRRINAALTGFEAALPDCYGLRAEELADLMNRYKAVQSDG